MDEVDLIALQLSNSCGSRCLDDEEDLRAVASCVVGLMGSVMVRGDGELIATFTWDDPPPSANKIYFVRGGRKQLTAKARSWKTRFVSGRGGLSAHELMSLDLSIEDQFFLDLWVYLPEGQVRNLKYGINRSTKYPFVKVDTSNFFKLAEDAITDLLGISCDRQNFDIAAHKRVADHRGSRLVARLYRITPTDDPLDPA